MKNVKSHILAYMVHAFTGLGLILAILSVYYLLVKGNVQLCVILLSFTAVVDGLDGTLARKFEVKKYANTIDGALLDNITDFLTYVFIPAIFILVTGVLTDPYSIIAACAIVFTSGYQFCQTNAKTDDHYFVGFPSYWNVLVLYLYWLNFSPMVNFIIILVFMVSVFIPVRYIYPSRTKPLLIPTSIITLPWLAILAYIVIFDFYSPPSWFMIYSGIVIGYYYLASLYLNFKYKLMSKG